LELQDPIWLRTGHREKGRDGCRVPLPWTSEPFSFGFGDAVPHLPQPDWFAEHAVSVQEILPYSTLDFYRSAIHARRELQTGEKLEWMRSGDNVLHFVRPGGWHSVTNFGNEPIPLPEGEVVASSIPLTDATLPGNATAWLLQ
jgi:alpha-glucosidase